MWDGRRCAFRQKKGAAGAINSLGMRFAKPSDTWQMIESHIFLAAEKKEENGTPAINHRHSLRPFFCTAAAANPPPHSAPYNQDNFCGEKHMLFPHHKRRSRRGSFPFPTFSVLYIYIWDIILRRSRTCAVPSFFLGNLRVTSLEDGSAKKDAPPL